MTRITIGLVAGCFLTILNIYPIYGVVLSPWNILNFGKLPVDSNNRKKLLADSSKKKNTNT